MTDITDQDRRAAMAWAKNWQGDQDGDTSAAARVILATVDAPEPTLAEELRKVAADYDRDGYPEPIETYRHLAARAEQMDSDLAEARAEVERERDLGVAVAHERDEVREALTLEGRRVEKIAHDRAEARAEAERLTAKVEDRKWEVQKYRDRCANQRKELGLLNRAGMELHAEVERLTAANENLRRTDNYQQFREQFLTVQKAAETPDPADVKPGEAWLIRVEGLEALAVRDGDPFWPWSVAYLDGGIDDVADDSNITLITRLVPAPRVITNADDLDALAEGSIIRAKDGDACRKSDGGDWSVDGLDGAVGYGPRQVLPVTVLWEPGA